MKKKLLFLALFLVLTTIIGTVIKNIEKSKVNADNLIPPIINENVTYEINSNISYDTIKRIIKKFFHDYKSALNESKNIKELGISRLYDSLDEEYVKYANITKENILEKIVEPSDASISIENIFWYQNGNIKTYIVKANIRNTENNKYTQKGFIIVTDQENLTYSLYLDDYFKEKGYDKIKSGQKVSGISKLVIEKKDANGYIVENVDTSTYLKEIYDDIRNYMLYDSEKAYSMLNSKQFKNYDDFKEFIESNYTSIFIMTLRSYNYNKQDNIEVYCCKDYYKNIELIIYANGYNDIKFEINKI